METRGIQCSNRSNGAQTQVKAVPRLCFQTMFLEVSAFHAIHTTATSTNGTCDFICFFPNINYTLTLTHTRLVKVLHYMIAHTIWTPSRDDRSEHLEPPIPLVEEKRARLTGLILCQNMTRWFQSRRHKACCNKLKKDNDQSTNSRCTPLRAGPRGKMENILSRLALN